MPDPIVHWREDGTPTSPRFGDIYRNAGASGLAQAQQVFLHGCGLLPEAGAAWTSAARWAVLENGFGLGLNFLATWLAWRRSVQRPAHLFYTAVELLPPAVDDLLRSAAPFPELASLASELARHWYGLLPGVHRIDLEGGRVHLTLAVGEAQEMLAELSGAHDSLFLDGFSPERNPTMWSRPVLAAATALLRPGARAASWCVARTVRDNLLACGFKVERVTGLAPKRHALQAHLGHRPEDSRHASRSPTPGRCVIIGAGLAGASAAWSLAQRGWQVTVLEQADAPATGASGLPAGVVAPHVSPDDRPLSALSRAGTRQTLARARHLLVEGSDFATSGVLERHAPGERRLPQAWQEPALSSAMLAQSLPAGNPLTRMLAQRAGLELDGQHCALWHQQAGWLKPASLVRALLAASGMTWQGNAAVAHIVADGDAWQLLDDAGQILVRAKLVVLAAGFDSLALLDGALPLHPLRGQIAFGPMPAGKDAARLPPFPVNGHGSLVAHLPGPTGPTWSSGSTFERENIRAECTPADHAANRTRLHQLLPTAAQVLDAQWDDGHAQAWAGVRATLPDRLPAVGSWPGKDTETPPAGDRLPLQLCTGLGARGLTLAVLCGELLAAELHGEPLPVAASLARHLRARRFAGRKERT